MIGEPVGLTVRRNIERPGAALLKAFRGAPTGFVTDAHNGQGCLDYRIKPIDPKMKICGPALTCLCSPTDNLAAMAVLDFARKGDVIVIAAKNDQSAAVIGDRWALWAHKIGVAGVVCDGLVRDIVGLLDVGLPVFARGLSPNSGFKHGPGEINTRVACGGIAVEPGHHRRRSRRRRGCAALRGSACGRSPGPGGKEGGWPGCLPAQDQDHEFLE